MSMHDHSLCCNTHPPAPTPPPPTSSISLPPRGSKRPWCFFEGLPRHISTANLACYACANVAKSSSLIVMTHKARPKQKCLSAIEPSPPPPGKERETRLYMRRRKEKDSYSLATVASPLWNHAHEWAWVSLSEEIRSVLMAHFTDCGKLIVLNYSLS